MPLELVVLGLSLALLVVGGVGAARATVTLVRHQRWRSARKKRLENRAQLTLQLVHEIGPLTVEQSGAFIAAICAHVSVEGTIDRWDIVGLAGSSRASVPHEHGYEGMGEAPEPDPR